MTRIMIDNEKVVDVPVTSFTDDEGEHHDVLTLEAADALLEAWRSLDPPSRDYQVCDYVKTGFLPVIIAAESGRTMGRLYMHRIEPRQDIIGLQMEGEVGYHLDALQMRLTTFTIDREV